MKNLQFGDVIWRGAQEIRLHSRPLHDIQKRRREEIEEGQDQGKKRN